MCTLKDTFKLLAIESAIDFSTKYGAQSAITNFELLHLSCWGGTYLDLLAGRPFEGVGAAGCCGGGCGGALVVLIFCWRRSAWPLLAERTEARHHGLSCRLTGLALSASSLAEVLMPAGEGEGSLRGPDWRSCRTTAPHPRYPRCSRGSPGLGADRRAVLVRWAAQAGRGFLRPAGGLHGLRLVAAVRTLGGAVAQGFAGVAAGPPFLCPGGATAALLAGLVAALLPLGRGGSVAGLLGGGFACRSGLVAPLREILWAPFFEQLCRSASGVAHCGARLPCRQAVRMLAVCPGGAPDLVEL
ncbi:hypothetical protein NDU88_005049 [Pleurodeles waltl]|uniref:Uncharacterized protein n=1 Tax=Pleurodeles waltl TaxID=8319 RepID=A0AAV7MZ01_PLEWA|nr:hypothetical protein NDU88_005049 [Pleurodeles waltl]